MTLTRRDTCQSCRGAGVLNDRRSALPSLSGHGHASDRAAAAWCSRRAATRAADPAGWSRPPCGRCGGLGVEMRSETITVRIPAGVGDGARIRVPEKGNAGERRRPCRAICSSPFRSSRTRRFSARGMISTSPCRSASTKRRSARRSTCRRPTAPRGCACRRGRRPGQRFHIRGRGAPSPRERRARRSRRRSQDRPAEGARRALEGAAARVRQDQRRTGVDEGERRDEE